LNFKEATPFDAPNHAQTKNHLSRLWVWFALGLTLLALCAWFFTAPSMKTVRVQTLELNSDQAMPFRLEFELHDEQVVATSLDPEHLVRQIYAALGDGERTKALALAGFLTRQFPTFQLGQLLYADLLNISSNAPVALPEVEDQDKPSLTRRLNELILESKRRINRPNANSLQGRVPSALLNLSPQQAYVAAVDASQSRLYWFENQSSGHGPVQLKLVRESYISVGLNGIGKRLEGDGKTPTGIYFVQKKLPGESLPDLFGIGALTLNYPNALDSMNKKTGSGIWLHGTPSAQYARAPESTDGCIVLSNPEMTQLLNLPGMRMTPVIISEKIDWVTPVESAEAFNAFKPSLDAWLAARNGTDADALKLHYSERFERDDMGLNQWWPRLAQTTLGHRVSKPLELISALEMKDPTQTMVVTLKDPNHKASVPAQYLRTYWQKEADQWKLVFQGPI